MKFWIITLILFVISFFWALISFKKEHGKVREVAHAKKQLSREKILFKR